MSSFSGHVILGLVAFDTTRWSLVLRAGTDDSDGARALDQLCQVYWPPVYALYRSLGSGMDEAQDLTQGLFADLLARGDLANADPARGRFRSFLRACAQNYAANQRDRKRAQKRGGNQPILSIDFGPEETRFRAEPIDRLDPAALFDRRWAQAIIETSLEQLAADEREAGRGPLFELLRSSLDGAVPKTPWVEVAAELGSSEGAVRVAAHRLRERFRERLLSAVRDTLGPGESGESGEDEDNQELTELLAALRP